MTVGRFNSVSGQVQNRPRLLDVRSGHFVIVQAPQSAGFGKADDWWMGQVVWHDAGAKDQKANALFQVADVDGGSIRWVHNDELIHVLHSLDGLFG